MKIRFAEFRGPAANDFLTELADLRMRVFQDYPYLYEGDLDYEKKYLNTYFASPKSFVALCFDDQKIVGACTAILLADEQPEFQKPFLQKGLEPQKICYFGESVLLPAYRGQGIGNSFMDLRLSFAKEFADVNMAAFCAVIREDNHPMKPHNYSPLDEFWKKRGFAKMPDFITEYSWRDIDEKTESVKKMQFWSKKI